MKRILILSFIAVMLLVVCAGPMDAQTRKAGINSAAFLKIGVGARQVALGSAVTTLSGDASNMFWNPAGIALNDQSLQASFTHNNWIAGLKQEAVAASYNLSDVGTIGLGFQTFGINGIKAVRDNGYSDPNLASQVIDQMTTGTYDYQDMALQLSYARWITDNLSIGASGKWIHEKIDDANASAFGFDFGAIYNIGVLGWSIGARLNNIGSDMKFYDYGSPIPLSFAIGTSMVPLNFGTSSVLLAVDLVKPQDGQQYYYSGMEINIDKTFFLRGGWKFNYSYFGLTGDGIDEGTSTRSAVQTSLEKGSFGGGIRVPFDEYNVNFDYAYTVFTALDGVHRFTIAFSMK